MIEPINWNKCVVRRKKPAPKPVKPKPGKLSRLPDGSVILARAFADAPELCVFVLITDYGVRSLVDIEDGTTFPFTDEQIAHVNAGKFKVLYAHAKL